MDSMKEALRQLEERKRSYEERINVYTTHFENSMSTMQRGKGCVMRSRSTVYPSDTKHLIGKSASPYRSPSSITMIGISNDTGRHLPTAPSYTRRSIYTRRESSSLSTSTPQDSSTSCRSHSRRKPQVSSMSCWKPRTWVVQARLPTRTSAWKPCCSSNTRTNPRCRCSTALPSSICRSSSVRSTRSE